MLAVPLSFLAFGITQPTAGTPLAPGTHFTRPEPDTLSACGASSLLPEGQCYSFPIHAIFSFDFDYSNMKVKPCQPFFFRFSVSQFFTKYSAPEYTVVTTMTAIMIRLSQE